MRHNQYQMQIRSWVKSLSMICGHGYTGLWPSWRPWWYLRGAPIWSRAPDWPSLWSLLMTRCHPMLGCSFSWFCSVPQLKTPSQHLRLHGATPGPVWWRQQASRILWLLSPMEMHQEHNGKTYLDFLLINTVGWSICLFSLGWMFK